MTLGTRHSHRSGPSIPPPLAGVYNTLLRRVTDMQPLGCPLATTRSSGRVLISGHSPAFSPGWRWRGWPLVSTPECPHRVNLTSRWPLHRACTPTVQSTLLRPQGGGSVVLALPPLSHQPRLRDPPLMIRSLRHQCRQQPLPLWRRGGSRQSQSKFREACRLERRHASSQGPYPRLPPNRPSLAAMHTLPRRP